ncbi:thioredoxin family protein [Chloroflexota bacterium]
MKEITDQDFDREVLKCELPVLACFTTRWCHSCYSMRLFTEELASKYDGRVKFVKVDKEESPEVSDRYNVVVVPTILIFKDSQPVKKRLGFQDRSSLRCLLNGAIAE